MMSARIAETIDGQSQLIAEALQMAKDFKGTMESLKSQMLEVGPDPKELGPLIREIQSHWISFQANLKDKEYQFEARLDCDSQNLTFKGARTAAHDSAYHEQLRARGFAECLIRQIEEED